MSRSDDAQEQATRKWVLRMVDEQMMPMWKQENPHASDVATQRTRLSMLRRENAQALERLRQQADERRQARRIAKQVARTLYKQADEDDRFADCDL